MPRKQKPNCNTRSIGISFDLQCFIRDSNNMTSSNIKYLCRCTFVITIIIIYLQYEYITTYYSENSDPKKWRKRHVFRVKTLKEIKIKRFPGFSTKQNQRIMSYERFISQRLAFKNLGPVKVQRSYISPRAVEKLKLKVSLGGYYAPPDCRPRHKVAVLITFRNRTANLSKFLRHMHPFLQKQLLEYRIFVIEQIDQHKFNKGALYNIGSIEIQRFGWWDCMVFHDVDLLPMDLRIMYNCPRMPAHLSPSLDCWGYQFDSTVSTEHFGGVTSMQRKMYLKVNGYSNMYWNWGAEDNDMSIRIKAAKLQIWRYNMSIARFMCLPHPKGECNPKRYTLLNTAKKRYKWDGLKSLQYKLVAIFERKLFTHILANVNPFNYKV